MERTPARVTYVSADGSGSMPTCSRQLAERLGVPEFRTGVWFRTVRDLDAPALSLATLRALREDLRLAWTLNSLGGVLHLSHHHLGRYGLFLSRPFLITVHDMIRYLDLTGERLLIQPLNARERLFLRMDYAGIRRALRVVAVSEHTRSDVVRRLGIPEERVRVIHNGLDHGLYRPVRGPRPLANPYVLFVGAEHPRKNLKTLLGAFAALKRDRRFRRLKLLKVGDAGNPEAHFRRPVEKEIRRLGLRGEVVFAGRVPQELMPLYYSHAECLAFPSLYEGFGLPPLEAMACGCPVVASNASAVPEVAGEAALLADPRDPRALAGALERVLSDGGLRRSLSRRGFARASLFTWERAARETRLLYEEVLEELFRHRRSGLLEGRELAFPGRTAYTQERSLS
ncbi:glycosyl transferase family 1 [Rubrobacter xylanophilus]|uniref:Glycosyl transferase family 1 n=1 Tax=Rubrobacter xylanophilus TaxID=49319 RepID=A0A510HMD4_9ACTN|nr:glycosyltransferase family 1 protein [Rubrobacter xylanophilus]BBL81179.1 glycosyl transferase family 1 [Rubrobacter xylanophilus]